MTININELQVFDQTSVRVKRPEAPNLRIHVKSGTFTLSITALELMDLKAGDQVNVGQSTIDKQEWYIWKVNTGGIKLKAANYSRKVNCVVFRNSSLAQKLANSVGFYGKSGLMQIAREHQTFESAPGVKVWTIITAKLKSQCI